MTACRTRGHPTALAAVERAVSSARPPHALLITGPTGVGKTTLALDLAAGLLCLAAEPAERPCGTCAACRKVAHGNHPDVHRVAPEGAGEQIRLPQVQALAAELALLPMEGRWRVAVVEAAHRLNPDAQNALLKTLEEPVGAACIVLCADDVAALLPTVISRTARLRLGPVRLEALAELLAERSLADAARSAALWRLSGGRPGIAMALAARPEATIVAARLARSLLDLSRADRRARLAAAPALIADGAALDAALRGVAPDDGDGGAQGGAGGTEAPAAGRPRAPRRAASGPSRPQPAERRRAVTRVLVTWRDVGRDLAVADAGARAAIRDHELLEDLEEVAAAVDRGEVLRFLERLDGLVAAIESYANPELVLDALLLAWPSAAGGAAAARNAA